MHIFHKWKYYRDKSGRPCRICRVCGKAQVNCGWYEPEWWDTIKENGWVSETDYRLREGLQLD